jgi:leucyl/phenylalanyl-tRNA--protein transferase
LNGAQLTPEMLHYAYSIGIFPMGDDDGEVAFYEPRLRALLPISGIRVSRSLAKTIRQGRFTVTFDRAFERVMQSCLRPDGNWITQDLLRVYAEIHCQGWGHSCEVWQEDELVGGVYGVGIGAVFSAESMFHRRRDMSKVALWAMVEQCRHLGFVAFDAQVQNPHLESLGAYEIPMAEYRALLAEHGESATPWSIPAREDW